MSIGSDEADANMLQVSQPAEEEPLTKAIVFSHLWTHTLLIEKQLREHGINVALFKSSMKPEEKAANLHIFKVCDFRCRPWALQSVARYPL